MRHYLACSSCNFCCLQSTKSLTQTTYWARLWECWAIEWMWTMKYNPCSFVCLVYFSPLEHYPNWFQLGNKPLRALLFMSNLRHKTGVGTKQACACVWVSPPVFSVGQKPMSDTPSLIRNQIRVINAEKEKNESRTEISLVLVAASFKLFYFHTHMLCLWNCFSSSSAHTTLLCFSRLLS